MADENSSRDGPTRREYVKYGGAVVSGGLIAGCASSGGDSESTPTETDADVSPEPQTTVRTPYSVKMEPMGTVEYDAVPETWLSFLSTYGDMGIALGQANGLQGLWNPEDIPTEFYDALPGVDVDLSDVGTVGSDNFDKETLFALDCDLHLVDPNWIELIADGWEKADTEEISQQVGPFLGNYIRRRGDDWHDYRYYSLYEAFEIVADAFKQRRRFEALRSVHEQMQSTISERLPDTDERPTVGLLSVNSDFEKGSFYVYPVQKGNNHKQYRDLEMRGAFDEHIEGSYAKWDYEQLLEVDPDALVFQYGFTHVNTGEFAARMEKMREDPVGGKLSAVQNDRLYRGGTSYQGPVVNLFQTEAAAKQFYPDAFGEWPGYTSDDSYPGFEADEQLFDRQRVADIINGNI
jgi:iron complex transport system substrate-binding protein